MNGSLALVVDAEASVRTALREELGERRVAALGTSSAAEALELLRARSVRLLLLDLDAGANIAGELISRARARRPPPLVIGLAAADHEAASRLALELGLFDLLSKPLSPGRVRFCVDRALRELGLRDEERRLREALRSREGFRGLVGRSAAVEHLRDELERLAPTELSVWLSGEPGAGKTLAARELHSGSARSAGPFVAVDCAALSRAEWDAQWKAHASGAEAALPLQARGGTLYLDRVPALDPRLQESLASTLARWARGAECDPAGARPRILAGSVEEPAREVQRGRLLPALHRRLAHAALRVPPLRERREDIALLCHHFIASICEINRMPPLRLTPESLRLLERYAWPANVRELRQAVEHAVILAAEETIRPEDLPERIRDQDAPASATRQASGRFRAAKRGVVEAFERAYLSELLTRNAGNVTLAARQAGMLRSALQRLLRKHRLKSAEFRAPRKRPPRREVVEKALD